MLTIKSETFQLQILKAYEHGIPLLKKNTLFFYSGKSSVHHTHTIYKQEIKQT